MPAPFHLIVVLSAVLLLAADAPSDVVPRSRLGEDVVGKKLPLAALKWLNTAAEQPIGTGGKVTLVRWWTDSCPYCARLLPAIQKLKSEYGEHFQTVAVYHPKPPGSVEQKWVLEQATKLGYEGVVALDQDWGVLRNFYLAAKRRRATSVSFLVDETGTVRFVHSGPVLCPTQDPKEPLVQKDYLDVRRAIEVLLATLTAGKKSSDDKPGQK